jgi:hypothetical protein
MLTEEADYDYFENDKISNMKKSWLESSEPQKPSFVQMKAKQSMNRTSSFEFMQN